MLIYCCAHFPPQRKRSHAALPWPMEAGSAFKYGNPKPHPAILSNIHEMTFQEKEVQSELRPLESYQATWCLCNDEGGRIWKLYHVTFSQQSHLIMLMLIKHITNIRGSSMLRILKTDGWFYLIPMLKFYSCTYSFIPYSIHKYW